MKTLPIIDSTTPVVNTVLAPYFQDVARELRFMTDDQRSAHLEQYKSYIEKEASTTKSRSLRLQLRINMQSLIQHFSSEEPSYEITVFPKHKQVRVFEGDICRDAYAEELVPMRA